MVPQAAPMRRIARYRPAIDAAIARVLDGGTAIGGVEVAAFEAAFAAFCGVGHAIGCGNGTDALVLALRAAGIGPGDEVITVALTAHGTAQAIRLVGAMPVFVEVDAATRTMDPAAAAAAITPRTTALIPVHLYGQMADMPALATLAAQHGLFLLEDCAQAHGAEIAGRRAGSWGHAAVFSFYPTKNLGAVGDGGAVITQDAALAERIRALTSYGWTDARRISDVVAGNSRLDTMQAAILAALLPHLDEAIAERRAVAAALHAGIGEAVILPRWDDGAVWHQFVIAHPARDRLAACLARDGIGTAVHYTPPLHVQPAFLSDGQPPLPITERLAAEVLSLPIQPEIAGPAIQAIIDAVRRGAAECAR
ncbi:DegT/DnrJ/EryC1/StrS family aminotransferase [Tabrizicola piscis]|uniref:DegT/DnrJ/EryC1/StrS family aminotransferase n=2 Tax=Tabrizicola piscis TaxID=2494374 RepID=A0A3S8U3S6_9RHOB|nr:DegT/DnrJ/EryC1/StrS family aminotransferase [Tabrizicola piscis]